MAKRNTHLRRLLKDGSSLTVAEDNPLDSMLNQHLVGQFASPSTIRLMKDVLSGDFDAICSLLGGCEEEDARWGDDDLCAQVSIE